MLLNPESYVCDPTPTVLSGPHSSACRSTAPKTLPGWLHLHPSTTDRHRSSSGGRNSEIQDGRRSVSSHLWVTGPILFPQHPTEQDVPMVSRPRDLYRRRGLCPLAAHRNGYIAGNHRRLPPSWRIEQARKRRWKSSQGVDSLRRYFRPFVEKSQKLSYFVPAIVHPATAWRRYLFQCFIGMMSKAAAVPWVLNLVGEHGNGGDGFQLPAYPCLE